MHGAVELVEALSTFSQVDSVLAMIIHQSPIERSMLAFKYLCDCARTLARGSGRNLGGYSIAGAGSRSESVFESSRMDKVLLYGL